MFFSSSLGSALYQTIMPGVERLSGLSEIPSVAVRDDQLK
jgi:hypothetical protein